MTLCQVYIIIIYKVYKICTKTTQLWQYASQNTVDCDIQMLH